jgi:hypothetical protein
MGAVTVLGHTTAEVKLRLMRGMILADVATDSLTMSVATDVFQYQWAA